MDEQIAQEQAQPAGEAEEALAEPDALSLFLDSLVNAVGVDTVFGDPVQVGERVVIPVAETAAGGGVGEVHFARGDRPPRIIDLSSGGGGGATTRPVAAIVVTPEGVRVEPIFDLSKIVLNSIASTAALLQGLAVLVRTLRRR